MSTFLRKNIHKIFIAVILIGVTALSFVLINKYTNVNSNEIVNVEIVIVDKTNTTLHDDHYKTNKSLYELVNDKYELRSDDSIYGKVLYDIAEIKTDFRTTYIAIYVDDKYSNYGISSIKLYDGIKITFKEEVVR